jgi:2-polyprenyl-6-methoxyphenol hydroxylase-like FAD-dependent oxidoreductase
MSKIDRVLIVGGGIGGLCAAIGLARAGIASDIVEIKRDWTVYGVGIIQPSNQLRALAELGLADACVERGAAFQGWEFCDDAGHVHAQVPNPRAASSKLPPINGIPRPILHDILTGEAKRRGVTVRLGLTVDDIENGQTHVSVRFSDDTTGRYDVLIGADGTYSKMRALMFPDCAKPVFNGLSVWRYNFPRPPGMIWGSVHYGRRAKAGLVPMSPSLMYMFVVTAEPGNPKMPRERMHDVMRGRLSEFTGIIAELREQIIEPAGVVYRPMEPMLLPAPWHRGRVLLIGDAVHATTPQLAQGASIAIEDAVLLAQLLPQDRPLEDIFAEFMRRRFERCKFVVETSLQIGRWEVAAFEGRPDPTADYAGLMAEAGRVLAEPY